MMKRHLFACTLALAALLAGCHSNLAPMKPVKHIETWEPYGPEEATLVPVSTATEPVTTSAATQASTQVALTEPTTIAPATRPGHKVIKVTDPNQTVRFIYKASYDNIWQQAMAVLVKTGFKLDRQDYRLGVITTQPLPSAQFLEFWKPQHTNFTNALENTVNSQDRTVRLTISKVPEKPDFYAIAIQVLVERETNPSEELAGPLFVEGSAFGNNSITLRSDYAPTNGELSRWVIIGHDVNLEKKLLDQLFLRI